MLPNGGIYGPAKDYMQVIQLACIYSEGRFCTVGKSSIMVSRYENLIIIGFQPIVQGRAKIMQSAEMVVCSRKIACSCASILHGRTNHHYR